MSYICNKLSSVFHTNQNFCFGKINTKTSKCLEVYIVQCCICTVILNLDCDSSTQSVLTKMSLFFFFSRRSQENKADLIKQMGVEKGCRGWVERCQRPCQGSQVQGGGGELPRTSVLLQGTKGSRRGKKSWTCGSLGAEVTGIVSGKNQLFIGVLLEIRICGKISFLHSF